MSETLQEEQLTQLTQEEQLEAQSESDTYMRLADVFDQNGWPFAGLFPEALEDLWINGLTFVEWVPEAEVAPDESPTWKKVTTNLYVGQELVLGLPGFEALQLVVAPLGGAQEPGYTLTIDLSAPSFSVSVPLTLRVDAEVLRPLIEGTSEPDPEAKTLDIELGEATLTITAEGGVEIELPGKISFAAEVAGTGAIVTVSDLQWGTPAGAGLTLGEATLSLPELEITGAPLQLSEAQIDATGFSGKLEEPALSGVDATLAGFSISLNSISLAFTHSTLSECEIAAEVQVPFLEAPLELALGLDGAGGLSVGLAGASASVEVGSFLALELTALSFVREPSRAALSLSGQLTLDVPGLECPPIQLAGLRIGSDGSVVVPGGWIDLPAGQLAPFHGFPVEVTKVGFGQGAGAGAQRWVGLNGGIKLADGLPLGASVEGLRISWDPAGGEPEVSLSGIELDFSIPEVLDCEGAVDFFSEEQGKVHGFRGHASLGLESLGFAIGANVVIGRAGQETFFYFELEVDLPAGIPLFDTGAAFFGFEGLIAHSMAPDREGEEPWYWGWYVRHPKGATGAEKWKYEQGAFALGLGTTIGTAADDGFTSSNKVLLILSLPGPLLLLEGKGTFLKPRPSATDAEEEGDWEALLVLDFASQLFEANVELTYKEEVAGRDLVLLEGGAGVAFSWAPKPPPRVWHVYLGEAQPLDRRWRANLLSVLTANAYLMVDAEPAPLHIALGGEAAIDESFNYAVVGLTVKVAISGEGDVSLRPQHLAGKLALEGVVTVHAFGASVNLQARAEVDARGPTPWFILATVQASIHVNLLITSFSWSGKVELTWGNEHEPLPQPVPVVKELMHEHLKADEAAPLESATVPADFRPLIVFNRPVADLPGVGVPALAKSPVDKVGQVFFAYRLGHVLLARTGPSAPYLAGAGVLEMGSTGIVLPGSPDLTGASGTIELLDTTTGASTQHTILSAGPGSLSLSSDPPAGTYAYRLTPAVQEGEVQVSGCWLPTGFGTGAGQANTSATCLSLWARTPFDWFRHNVSYVYGQFAQAEPNWPCGPQAIEEPEGIKLDWHCIAFDEPLPQSGTETQSYEGMLLEPTGTMSVQQGVLIVTPRTPLLEIPQAARQPQPASTAPVEDPPQATVPAPSGAIAEPALERLPGSSLPRPIELDAALTIVLPEPATRVRLTLTSTVTVTAYGGAKEVASAQGTPAAPLELAAASGYIDRLVLVGAPLIGVSRICDDAGGFAWERAGQETWRQGMQNIVESLSEEDPVLAPGTYRLDVYAGVASGPTEAALSPTSWPFPPTSASFTVGEPPGYPTGPAAATTYPGGGPLTELATYVAETMPLAGARPFFRAYDVGASFNESYVTRLYMAAGYALTVAVVDANQHELRSDARNLWGHQGPVGGLLEESVWQFVASLHEDEEHPCVQVNVSSIERNQTLTGAGALLAPAQLHSAQLRSAETTVLEFDLTTSAYGGFRHLASTFAGALLPSTTTAPAAVMLPAALTAAQQALSEAVAQCAAALAAVSSGSPTQAQYEAAAAARQALVAARQALREAQASAFTAIAQALEVPTAAPAVAQVELTPWAHALLWEAPEPIDFHRVQVSLQTAVGVPLRTSTIEPDMFADPDAGEFTVAGYAASTTAELWCTTPAAGTGGKTAEEAPAGAASVLRGRVNGTPWSLTLTVPGATAVSVTASIDSGGRLELTGTGTGVRTPRPLQGPATAPVTLEVSGESLTTVTLTGLDASIASIAVTARFSPVTSGPVRILDAQLAGSASSVALIAQADTELAGWSVRWYDALHPGAPSVLKAFTATSGSGAGGASEPPAIGEAQVACVGSTAAAPYATALWPFETGVAPPPASGAVFQLVDPGGAVSAELAVMPAPTQTPGSVTAIPNEDGTRAWLVAQEPLPTSPAQLVLELGYSGEVSDDGHVAADLPPLTIGGQPVQEAVRLRFTVG